MRNFFLFTALLLILLSPSVNSAPLTQSKERTLLLMHPTVSTVSGICWLIDNGIFPVKNVKLRGVCHSREASDYSASEEYIREHGLPVTIERISDSISPANLYGPNPCSTDFERLFGESIGVIFFGGPDIPPAIYGEKTSSLTVITDPWRHYFEASFLFHLLGGYQDPDYTPLLGKRPGYLVLGFCLGMQTLNIATGGSLVQDIPLEVYHIDNVEDILDLPSENLHRNYYGNLEDAEDLMWANIHPVIFSSDSRIIREGIIGPGERPGVVSSHHQAAEKVGKDLRVAARSADGKVIEALEHTKYPNVFAFQFHPEVPDIYNYDNSYRMKLTDEPESLRAMIERSGGYAFHIALWKNIAGILNTEDPR